MGRATEVRDRVSDPLPEPRSPWAYMGPGKPIRVPDKNPATPRNTGGYSPPVPEPPIRACPVVWVHGPLLAWEPSDQKGPAGHQEANVPPPALSHTSLSAPQGWSLPGGQAAEQGSGPGPQQESRGRRDQGPELTRVTALGIRVESERMSSPCTNSPARAPTDEMMLGRQELVTSLPRGS